MAKKIFVSVFFVATAVAIVCTAIITGIMYDYFSDEYTLGIIDEANLLRDCYEKNGADYLKTIDSAIGRITLIEADGTVIYDNYADYKQMDNHLSRTEVELAVKEGIGSAERYSQTISKKTFYYALKLSDGRILRLASSRYTLMALILGISQPVIVVFGLMAGVSIFIFYRLSHSIVEPINSIDLDKPERESIYEELLPLVERIRTQNILLKEKISELSRKQQEFAAITENMSEGIIIVDKNMAILSYNHSSLKYLSMAMGKPVLSNSAPVYEALETALENKHVDTSGEINSRICQVIANPVFQEENLVGAVALILDMSEHYERERMRREFTANVSHELKTPLTSISGTAEILAGGMVKAEDIPHFAKNIYNEAQRLINLMADIIRLSQLDEKAAMPPKETVDLKDVAESVAERLKKQAQKRNITIAVSGEKALVYGISRIIDEMIYNICENAVKYNVNNGKVDILVSPEASCNVVKVTDTGIGIPRGERERIFERFYRVDKSHSKDIGGTGLGLSIVKHGAAYHNATVTVDSAPSGGTVFTVSFPIPQ